MCFASIAYDAALLVASAMVADTPLPLPSFAAGPCSALAVDGPLPPPLPLPLLTVAFAVAAAFAVAFAFAVPDDDDDDDDDDDEYCRNILSQGRFMI